MNIDGHALLLSMISEKLMSEADKKPQIKAAFDIFEKYGVEKNNILPMMVELQLIVGSEEKNE